MKMITKIGLAILPLLIIQSCITKQASSSFFSNSKYDTDGSQFVKVDVQQFLSRADIKSVLAHANNEQEISNFIQQTSEIKILTVEDKNDNLFQQFSTYLDGKEYKEWGLIEQNGKKFQLIVKNQNDHIRKMVITLQRDKTLVFVDISGKYNQELLSKIFIKNSDS